MKKVIKIFRNGYTTNVRTFRLPRRLKKEIKIVLEDMEDAYHHDGAKSTKSTIRYVFEDDSLVREYKGYVLAKYSVKEYYYKNKHMSKLNKILKKYETRPD